MPKRLQAPPAPAWSGFMIGVDEAFANARNTYIDAELPQRLERLHGQLKRSEEDRTYYVNQLRSRKNDLAGIKAAIRRLEAQVADRQAEVHAEDVERQIEFIKALPGVLGIRVADGTPVVLVRTRIVRGDKTYDMGDFEIYLKRSTSPDDRVLVPITMTRTGTKSTGHGYYNDHRYYHGAINARGECLNGWFCFGGRLNQLRSDFASGEWGEMIHLMIASMNGMNEGEDGYLQVHRVVAAHDPAIDGEEEGDAGKKDANDVPTTPAPEWSGWMNGISEAFTASMKRYAFVALDDELARQKRREVDYQGAIDGNVRELKHLRQHMAEIRTEIKAIEAKLAERQAEVDPAEIARQLELIKSLPGVLGIRVEDGVPVVLVRTRTKYRGATYDLGDFEIHLRASTGRGIVPIAMVRTGTQKDGWGDYYSRNGYTGLINRFGEALGGYYQFGDALDQLKKHFADGEWDQMVQLMLEEMCKIEHWYQETIPEAYVKIAAHDPAIDGNKEPARRGRRREKQLAVG